LEDKVASGGIFVTYPEVSEAKAQINIQTHLKNDLATTEKITVKNRLYFKSKLIEETETSILEIPKNSDQEVSQNIVIKQPNLWSPEHPNLYTLNTQILKNNEVIDEEIQRIGIKTMKFVGQDFYLNGKKTFLRGVNRHQEYPCVGYALSDQANFRDAKKIKEAGFDYVRLSHYPQSPAFMDACDELGLVTINAILGWQYFSEDEAFQKHVFQTARDLIRRDRNRASVLAWEVSLNESWMPEHFIDSLNTIAKQEYPTNQCFTAGWQDYGYDIYLQARQHRLKHYDTTLTKPYNVSEYGDWEYYAMNAGLNQDAWGDLLQQERSSRQLRNAGETALLQQATNIQEAHNDNLQTPAFADGYWAMFDYNRGYADDLEASGIMDIFRIPKPSYYFFQSQRDHDHPFGKPMIYIANQWKTNSPLDVRIFSNCEEVELFLNGKSLGKQKPDENRISSHLKHPPFTFTIPSFEKGKLTAQGFINGKRLATHTVHSPEEPKQIKLDVDLRNFELTNNDLVFVYAKILDENGTLLTDVEDKIEFKIEGDAELIGENPVKIDAGIASILLKTKNNVNDLVLSVSSNILKLKPAKISLKELRLQKDVATHSDKTQKVGSKKIIRGNSNKKQVALTFDDGPSEITKNILAILKAYNVKATFFWQGKNLKAHQAIINQALKDGHQIENHSWNHENGHAASNEDLWENQVHKTNLEFQKYGIPKPKYYRPPFGAITNQQINFLFNKNIKTALWSITTLDWDKSQNTEGKMFSKFKNELHKGAIVLLHDL
jgi:beta-galactosidase